MVEASQTPIQLIQIHSKDNIGLLPCTVEAGSSVCIDGAGYPVAETLPLGHKIALRPIPNGERVIKYGVSIGSATIDIPTGAHVHVHNMKSDYIPTFTLEEGKRFTR
jgi:altronate dehydratase